MKGRILKKSSIAFMTAMLMATSISGCGKPASSGDGGTSVSKEDSNLVGNVYKTGLPIVKEKVTYKVIVKTSANLKQPAKDVEGWKVLEKETNIALDLEEIPDTTWNEKVPLLISSGSLPDFFTESMYDITTKYYNTGLFKPLNDLVDTWAPNIKKIISDKEVYANLKAADGKLYATPRGEMAPWLQVGNQLFINKVWLDKLGLKIPETTEDYFNVLKAFKERDPNGNGKQDEIPFTFSYNMMKNIFSGAFGLALDNNLDAIENKKYVFGPSRQEFKEWLQYLNRLYAEGLLDKDLFTQQTPQIKAKGTGTDQLLGSFTGFWPDTYVKPEKVADYTIVKPLKGPKGSQQWTFNKTKMIPNPTGVSISKNCKNPEAVIRWVDNILSSTSKTAEYEYGPSSLGGIELLSDGKYKITTDKPAAELKMTAEQWSRNFTLREMLPLYYSSEGILNSRVLDDVTSRKLSYQDVYKPFMQKEGITKAHFNGLSEDEKSWLTTAGVEMNPMIENFIAKSVIQGLSDDTWNKFQDDLKKANMEKVILLKQKALDSYYNALK